MGIVQIKAVWLWHWSAAASKPTREGTPHARARVSLVSWEEGSHAVLFMVPLGLPGARPMAQVLRLPSEYLNTMFHTGGHPGISPPRLHDVIIIRTL